MLVHSFGSLSGDGFYYDSFAMWVILIPRHYRSPKHRCIEHICENGYEYRQDYQFLLIPATDFGDFVITLP